jgi:hypothetical protein
MSTYKPSGVDVVILDNPNIINLAGIKRVPAIVGLGPSILTVTDEPIIKGVGAYDSVKDATATLLTITKIANTPGVLSGSLSYLPISANGNLYALGSASIVNPGSIQWVGTGVNIPSTGSVYYVSYTAALPSTQYDPTELFDKTSLINKYGSESATAGILTTAGSIALENGAPSVILVQASGSTYSEAAYKTAIDKLQKKTNVSYVSAVFPSGSVTRVQQESLLTYLFSHVQLMSNNKKERGIISGSPSIYSAASDGFDVIGDTTVIPSYAYRASVLKSRNSIYVVPSVITRKDANNVVMNLDGNFAAVAVAGVFAARDKESIPVNGFTVNGITIENEKWSEFETNQLGASNCFVLESKSNIVTVKRSLTTDPTSADTQEPSVVDVQRLVKRSLRDGLTNTYTNKGKTVTSTTTNDVIGTTLSILQSLVNDGEINTYGKIDNPLTGEIKISAKQNTTEPRQVDVTCSYKPNYPFIWISVTVSTYI